MSKFSEAWHSFKQWPWAARLVVHLAAFVVLLLVCGLLSGITLIRRPFPQLEGTAELQGLSAAVDVVRDEQGIPQIYADTLDDLMRAQGYVHAQDRFYEMDVRRHVTAGRLSELFGESTVETDKTIRAMGWRRVAERELAMLAPQTRTALEAYAAGVNEWMDGRSPSEMSVEYSLLRLDGLDYEPEPWTPVDSLAWLKAMAWDLRGNMQEEISRALALVDHTDDQVADLYPDYPYARHSPIVTQGALVDGRYEPQASKAGTRDPARVPYTADQAAALRDVQRAFDSIPALIGQGDGIGSNSWVVAGEHTETGKPLLANDPHLGTSLPGVWTQVGLHCRELSSLCPVDVSGFSFSGVPGVVIGHNQSIAWGFTNLGPDVSDLYLERISGDNWYYDGRYRPLITRREVIKVRGSDDVNLTVRETAHGPLLSDVSDELSTVAANAQHADDADEAYAVSLQWTALRPDTTADAILALNRATNWTEFRAAASKFSVPAQNLVYADRDGHIGYQAPGRIPIRSSGNDGSLPSKGWLPENDWTGSYLSFDSLPQVLDPDEGFVVTANQAVVGKEYPAYLTDDFDPGYRSQRIRDLIAIAIADGGKVSVEEMSRMQLDNHVELADTLVPYLLGIPLPRGYQRDGRKALLRWDRQADADSAGAAYFNVVWRNLLELTFGDEMRDSLRPDGDARWWRVVEQLLDDPDNAWWDDHGTDDIREDRDDILRAAMLAASDEIVVKMARDPGKWEWGQLHRLDLRSQTLGSSGNPLLERLFNRSWKIGGGSSVVNATGWDAAEGYAVTSAPSMRMVVSLADFDDSRWINLTGASGHVFHDNYTDQTDLYVEGRTLPWRYSQGAVRRAGTNTLTLVPAD
ncbi:penicillin acylase family protein [Nocardioides sp. Bht2]|uniref:penicillin acylase family protein n=1 Tax=Nocardioides sp. Bht2 TaxID=3392297 RepID=UPI0039B6C298